MRERSTLSHRTAYQGAKALYLRGDDQLTIESWVLERYRDRGYSWGSGREFLHPMSLVGYLAWDLVFCSMSRRLSFTRSRASLPTLAQKAFAVGAHEAWSRLREEILSASAAEILSLLEERIERYRNTYCTLTHMRYDAADFEPWLRLPGSSLVRESLNVVLDEFATLRRGFPDLIIWNQNEWRLVEVKGSP